MNDNNKPIAQADEAVTAVQDQDVSQAEDPGWEAPVATQEAGENGQSPWLSSEDVEQLKTRWNSIQIEFVDAPRTSVEKADELVVDTLEQIEKAFAQKRTILDDAWINHEDISTEDLRIALKNYRSFLDRLLAL